MIVVADTSPLLNLERIGRLELLPTIYGEVLIPAQVLRELTESYPFPSPAWLHVEHVENTAFVLELREDLDPGESEAIVLAKERGADLLLIDEHRGRRIAVSNGLVITGLLGVLIEAKRRRVITEVRPVLEELVQIARFRVGDSIIQGALKSVGEL